VPVPVRVFRIPAGDWQAGERGLAALPGRSGLQHDALRKAIEYARITHTPRLHLLAGIPNLQLQFDICHRQVLHGDVTKARQRPMPTIDRVQVASVPDRTEPGRGEFDDARVFGLLDRLGYEGYIGAEYRPAKGTVEGLDWFRSYCYR
jgi:hydroxypyruvate isomerase